MLTPAIVAVLARIGLIAAACWAGKISVGQLALLHDGWEYLRLARAFAHGSVAALDPATLRLFPGYPLLIAALGLGREFVYPAFWVSIGCAGLCVMLVDRLGRDRRLGWYMALITPSWLMFTSTAMSDSLALALAMGALLAIERRRWAWAGLAAGMSFVVRPVGALLIVPIAIEARACGPRVLVKALVAAAWAPLVYFVSSRVMLGDAMRAARQYTAQDFAWPLWAILHPAQSKNMGALWIVYQYGVIAASWLGAVGLWRRMRSGEDYIRPMLAWHVAAGLFYLLLPSSWAFQAMDRFYIAIWPTALIGVAPWLPRRKAWNIALVVVFGAASFGIALRWLAHLAAVFPFAARGF